MYILIYIYIYHVCVCVCVYVDCMHTYIYTYMYASIRNAAAPRGGIRALSFLALLVQKYK